MEQSADKQLRHLYRAPGVLFQRVVANDRDDRFLVVIALDNWTINVLNLYTGGLSLSNMFERLGRFWTTVIISLLGIALSATPDVVKGYTSYVGM